MFQASATLTAPSVVQDSAAAVNLFVTDLVEQVTSDSIVVYVLDRVPQLSPDEYLRGAAARRLGATSLVEVLFTHADRQVAQETVESMAYHLVDESARGEFDRATYLLEQAQGRIEEAQQGIADFVATEGVFDPEIEYGTILDEIASIDRQITTATFEDADQSSIEILNQQRAALVTERDRLGSVLLTYDTLTAELDRARQELEQARSRFVEAVFEYSTVNTPEQLIVSRDVVPFVNDSARLQQTALAAAIALVLTLSVLVPAGRWLGGRSLAGRHQEPRDGDGRVYDISVDPAVDVSDRVYERR